MGDQASQLVGIEGEVGRRNVANGQTTGGGGDRSLHDKAAIAHGVKEILRVDRALKLDVPPILVAVQGERLG